MSRVAAHWRLFLLLWLVMDASAIILIHLTVRPTYEAFSLLRIEPNQPEILGPLREKDSGEQQHLAFLKTQIGLMTSERVLNPAVADSSVVNLPTIRNAEDPKRDLREKLKVEIVSDTNLIKVALELPNPDEAVAVVKAVVQSYLMQSNDRSRSANRELTESLKQQLAKIAADIDTKKHMLNELVKRGKPAPINPREMLNPKSESDPTQATFRTVTEEQFAKMVEKQIECDLEYLQASSHLEATRSVRERNLDRLGDQLETHALEEFKKDPKVAALTDQIDESKRLGDSNEQAPSPAVVAAREKRDKLIREFERLRADAIPGIIKRLADADRGLLSEAKIRELEVTAETARRKKDSFAQQLDKIRVQGVTANDDRFETTHLNRQLNSLMSWEEQVRKNLEQLKFEASQDRYRVVLVDPASASKTPSNGRVIKYMAFAPIFSFLLVLGLFMSKEIKAGARH